MNQYSKILDKAAKQTGIDYVITESDKSEASYLKLKINGNSDFYDCLTVRLASHTAMTAKSMSYEIQLDSGFDFNYSANCFETKWGIDEDGDFEECLLEDAIQFNDDNEMIDYMANCLCIFLMKEI